MLSCAFAGDVDEERLNLYSAALEELSDEELARATTIVVKTHTGGFIPPPAVILKAVAATRPTVDVDAMIRSIENLGKYSPHVGKIYPRVEAVRQALGDGMAYAYAAAGGKQLFSENDVSRQIATREFQKAAEYVVSLPAGSPLPVIGGPLESKSLPSPVEPLDDADGELDQ
jgi:hypothetical protein